MRFIGHLDVMRYFQKAIRRAEIPIAFTTGYSPHMIMSFAQPLGVGVTSDGEYFDIEITEPISSEKAVAQLNAVMVEGVEVISFREISSDKKASGMTIVAAADYKVTFPETFQHAEEIRTLPESWKEKVDAFMAQPEIAALLKEIREQGRDRLVDVRTLRVTGQKDPVLGSQRAAGAQDLVLFHRQLCQFGRMGGDGLHVTAAALQRGDLCVQRGQLLQNIFYHSCFPPA